jgi:ATP-dependent DNA helicase RecG
MNEAYEYISLSNNLNSTFDGLKRVEHPDYPEFAVREALINAIVHRDYDYSGSIIVNIFDNRIEIVSLGGLVKGITVEDIKNGISQARNTIIANVFYRLKLIESYGTGIKRIVEAYQKQALQPSFNPATASFAVTLPKMINSRNDDMSDRDKALAVFKVKDKVTRKDIEVQLDCSKSVAVRILNALIEDGLVEKSGEARAAAYKLK